MNQTVEAKIAEVEDRLRQAMLDSDVAALDSLLARDLIFTNHFGHLMGKEDDLAAHRAGVLRITELNPSERKIHVKDGVAIVSVRTQLMGTYAGNPANGDFRFTRVWALSPDDQWQVIAAHSGLVA